MSDRERRVLESIEQELRRSDPQFVRRFARLGRRRMTGPAMLLVIGLRRDRAGLGHRVGARRGARHGHRRGFALVAAYHRPLGFGFRGRT